MSDSEKDTSIPVGADISFAGRSAHPHPHPQISEYDRRTRFVQYDKDSGAGPALKAFFKALVAEREEPSARFAMEAEAVAFIEGKHGQGSPPPAYEGQFVPGINDFKTIMKTYLKCRTQLHQFEVMTYDELETVVLENIGDWDTVREDIEKQDYIDEKERAWGSLFALTITLGYDYTLLDRLIKTLVTAKLVEIAAFKHLTDEEVSRMANATILLPNEIFPLPPAHDVEDTIPPPTKPQTVTVVLEGVKPFSTAYCSIPEGYKAKKAFVSIIFNRQGDTAEVIVGREKAAYPPGEETTGPSSSQPADGKILTMDLPDSDSECSLLPVSIMCGKQPGGSGQPVSTAVSSDDHYYIAHVQIRCDPAPEPVNSIDGHTKPT